MLTKTTQGPLCPSISLMFAVAYSLLLTSCVNNFPDEIYEPGTIPISISTSLKQNNTRISENEFDPEETIGLYITIEPSSIKDSRYIDNMRFTYNSETGFVPDETIFFPESNGNCDFISYYPYRNNAINKGNSGIEVEVQPDQSTQNAMSVSDFLVAKTKGVTASEKPVELLFEHKLFKLNLQLKVESGYTIKSLLDEDPIVKIKDVYTKGIYDFDKEMFANLSDKADVTPHGNWYIQDDMLCGKSAIIIPQTLAESHMIVELHIGNRSFECELSEEHVLKSGIEENTTITLVSSNDALESSIVGNIDMWSTEDYKIEAKERSTAILVSQLDFSNSNVIKVLNRDKLIAEICLEYLCTNSIESQAVVVYPAINGKADLTNGFVVELKEEAGGKHGGKVSWNIANNSLTYTEGNTSVPTYIYVSSDGEIKTSRPANALHVQLKPDKLVDIRGSETIEYPIVKIGTRYWTQVNLKATKYTDGTDIEVGGENVNSALPQYYHRSNYYFFYNSAALTNDKLIAADWRVANETDYNQLKTYVNNNAEVLKNGVSWGEDVPPNLTGFNSVATGYYNPAYMNNRTYAAYWCSNDDVPSLADRMVTLSTKDNNINIGNVTGDIALAIKCVRK